MYLFFLVKRFLYDIYRSCRNGDCYDGRSFRVGILYVVLVLGRDLNCEFRFKADDDLGRL